MSSHRFYLPPAECRESTLTLAGGEAHHAVHVLRLRAGERITVLDGAGQELLGQVREVGRKELGVEVLERRSIPPPPCKITLLQALPKGKLIETIIQKATELGAARLVPLLSERVVLQLAEQERTRKAEKWQAVAVEAIKQCGSAWLTRVEPPVAPGTFLARREVFELSLVGSLQPGARHPRHFFEAFRKHHGREPESLAFWIGPEGDFTPGELEAIEAGGALPVTLGPLVLRTDTAAMYCLSIANYEIRDAGPPEVTGG